jgi:hypothetical protein
MIDSGGSNDQISQKARVSKAKSVVLVNITEAASISRL